MQIDPRVIDAVKQIDARLEVEEAVANEESEFSFEDESQFNAFKKRDVKGIQFSIPADRRDDTVQKLQGILGTGFVVYFSAQNFGDSPDEITVLETTDPFDALRFEGCNGVNYDVYTEDIIAHLKTIGSRDPFVLTGAGYDFLQGRFLSPVSDPEELAVRMYEFCPDIVDQGTGDVASLADEIKKTNSLYYWWD